MNCTADGPRYASGPAWFSAANAVTANDWRAFRHVAAMQALAVVCSVQAMGSSAVTIQQLSPSGQGQQHSGAQRGLAEEELPYIQDDPDA